MTFVHPSFFLLLLILLVAHWSVPGQRFKNALLLAFSYYFYSIWDFRFLGLLWLSTVVDYGVGLVLPRTRYRRLWLSFSVLVNLSILGTFKYFNFFMENAQAGLEALGFSINGPLLEIALPAGVSFYTFQTLSYTIDVYRKRITPCRSLLDFALFVAFFPQLVSGPIVRAPYLVPQIRRVKHWHEIPVRGACLWLLIGFTKKAVIADSIGMDIDAFYLNPSAYGTLESWLLVAGFYAQLYCDFSGYCDMAIGLALLFGIQLPNNFNQPFISRSFGEFWRRWHITLSLWFRHYVMTPLMGRQSSERRKLLSLLLTMTLVGFWHGASWGFVVWGFFHGVALMVERTWRKQRFPKLSAPVATGVFWFFLIVSCPLFRADSLEMSFRVIERLFQWHPQISTDPRYWVLAPVLFALHLWGPQLRSRLEALAIPNWVVAPVLGAAFGMSWIFSQLGEYHFFYFQF